MIKSASFYCKKSLHERKVSSTAIEPVKSGIGLVQTPGSASLKQHQLTKASSSKGKVASHIPSRFGYGEKQTLQSFLSKIGGTVSAHTLKKRQEVTTKSPRTSFGGRH
mmetsp:Transcript_36227/g.55646  ORF Transcript_36227/g.55646 Transcript_36227/m.55646 type:complete len:108 (+) Transcript_36227:2202-2525(+)